MFQGRHEHVLDEKGRTSLPKGFRTVIEESSGESPWITTFGGEDLYLVILPDPMFKAIAENLGSLDLIDMDAESLRETILGEAEACPVDKQGRFLIPPSLRSLAGLDRDIVIKGVGTHIQIWERSAELARRSKNLKSIKANPAKAEVLKFVPGGLS